MNSLVRESWCSNPCVSENNLRPEVEVPSFREGDLLLPGVLCLYSFSGIFFFNGFVVFPSLAPRQLTLQSLGCGFASGLPLSQEYCPLRPSLTWRGFFSLLWAGPRLFHLPQGGPNLNLYLSRWPNILMAHASMRGFWGSSLAPGLLHTKGWSWPSFRMQHPKPVKHRPRCKS